MIDTYKTVVISYSSRAVIILSVILSFCLLALNAYIYAVQLVLTALWL